MCAIPKSTTSPNNLPEVPCRHLLVNASGIADARQFWSGPAAMLLELPAPIQHTSSTRFPHILALGKRDDVASHPAARNATHLDLNQSILIPALVNAHTHLDLTHIGPQPFDQIKGFSGWVHLVQSARHTDARAISESVRSGIALSIEGGTAAVGDIAGQWSTAPFEVLRKCPLMGVSFIEAFGLGNRANAAADRLTSLIEHHLADHTSNGTQIRIGIQPHAPYSAGRLLYQRAAKLSQTLGAPLSTHLAESPAERALTQCCEGPLRLMLESMNLWGNSTTAEFNDTSSPISRTLELIDGVALLAAHVADCTDDDLDRLARAPNVSVAYCPRSADYFGYPKQLGTHRYREMLSAGINVCFGTDSIINIPPPQAYALSVLDEARLLYQRDSTDPALLLQMATINGAIALGIDSSLFEFSTHTPVAGVLAIQSATQQATDNQLRSVFLSTATPRWVAGIGALCPGTTPSLT